MMPSKRPGVFDGHAIKRIAAEVKGLKNDELIVTGLVGISQQLDYIARLLETSAKAPSN
jgi:hypothetical protein